jgi:type II secretory pathway component PulF
MAEVTHFSYSAINPAGRRVKGAVVARDDTAAFDQLRREGLSPLSLTPKRARPQSQVRVQAPGARDSADFLASLGDLLAAGADIRTALSILGQRSDRAAVRSLSQRLSADIGSGEALDRAFGRSFQGGQAFVGSLIAAGESSGDLPGSLQRAAEIIHSRLKLRDQLVSVMAYPSFVFASAIAAVFVILLFIVPSIAPLAEEAGGTPPLSLRVLIAASGFLRAHLTLLGAMLAGAVLLGGLASMLQLLAVPFERLFLDGPARRTTRAVVFGGFSISLGSMISAGAPISEALRLATRAVGAASARRRLDPVIVSVRQGQQLSYALMSVKGFPGSIIRLAAVGEASNTLGQMLTKGGRLEEDAAMRRIETFGRLAGPALIVLLGLLLGVLMGGLLSGVSQMGQAALG